MKHVLISALFAALVTFWLSSSAQAGTRDPAVNAHQHRQHERIGQGVRSGELSGAEAQQLRAEQRAIRAKERSYKSDGVLTAAERQDLKTDQKAASEHIYQEKHDTERRF
jgi:hypothetical protein